VQVDPAAPLRFDLVDFALVVALTTTLNASTSVSRRKYWSCLSISDGHAGRVAGYVICSTTSSSRDAEWGVHCSFCGTFTEPFSQVEGLFTVLIRRPCLEGRQIQPDTLPDLHDSGDPWE
jgi:hypothetical protein